MSTKNEWLVCACERNDVARLRSELDRVRANVNSVDPIWCRTPFMVACIHKSIDVVRFLVHSGGADVNVVGPKLTLRTALMYACDVGFDDGVEFLVAHQACIGARDAGGKTALHFAAMNGFVAIAKRLLAADASILDSRDNDGKSALAFAIECGHFGMLRLLVERGADIEMVNGDGLPAISMAARRSQLDALVFLADHGANIDFVHKNDTPLTSAVSSGDEAVVCELLLRGADMNASPRTRSLIHMAAMCDAYNVLPLLIACGFDVDATAPSCNKTALAEACYFSFSRCIALLLAAEAKWDIEDDDTGVSALAFADSFCDGEVVALFVAAGASTAAQFTDEQLDDAKTTLVDARKRLADAKVTYAATRERWLLNRIRGRATEICVAMQGLELPALLSVMIIDAACPGAIDVRFGAKWQLVTAVKHFQRR